MDEMHVALVMEVLVGFGFVACLGRGEFGCGLVWIGNDTCIRKQPLLNASFPGREIMNPAL
jgi:hypothetical protein